MSSHPETDVRPAISQGESELNLQQASRFDLTKASTAFVFVGILFVGYSLVAVPVPGVNEPHYLTKARAYSDPEWCRNDFFLKSSNAHAVFYFLVGPLTKFFPLAAVAVAGRIISLLLLASGWTMIARRLGLSFHGIATSAAALCLIALSGNFSGEWIIGGFESKVPAYGFAFVSIAFWLDARTNPTTSTCLKLGVALGLAIALHPVVGAWFAIGFALAELLLYLLFARSRLPFAALIKNGLVTIIAALVCALPGLIPALKLALAAGIDDGVQDSANRIQVYWRLAHHLDPSSFPLKSWVHAGVLASLTALGLVVVMRFRWKSNTDDGPGCNRQWGAMATLLGMSLLIAAGGVFVGWHSEPFGQIEDWQWRARILRYYPFRFFDALLPCTCAFVVGSLANHWLRSGRLRVVVIAILAVAVFAAAGSVRRNTPAAYSASSFQQWKEVCEWLKQNTPDDSLVMSPRESFGMKWYAERAEYVCFKDCPQDGPGIVEWNARLGRLFTWAQTSYDNERFDDKDLRRLNRQTGITHIVTRRLGPFESEPVFRNQIWRVYEVRISE